MEKILYEITKKIDGIALEANNYGFKLEIQHSLLTYSMHSHGISLSGAHSTLLIYKSGKIVPYYATAGEGLVLRCDEKEHQDEIGTCLEIHAQAAFKPPTSSAPTADPEAIGGTLVFKIYNSIKDGFGFSTPLGFVSIQIKLDTVTEANANVALFGFAPLYLQNEGTLNLSAETPSKPENITFYSNGWQSWSFNYLLDYYTKWPSSHIGMVKINLENQERQFTARYQSEVHAAITDKSTQSTLILGFITNKDQFGTILMERLKPNTGLEYLCAYTQTDKIPLKSLNQGLQQSEILMLTFVPQPEGYEALAELCRVTGKLAEVKIPSQVIGGWCSWYYYYTKISEKEILSNLDFFKNRKDIPIGLIQLDDGYQTSIGDWGIESDTFNAKFPHGLKWLVDNIHDSGYQAGLWVAPFFTTKKAKHFQEHPQWALRNENGKLINTLFNWGAMQYGIDVSLPDALQYVNEIAKTVGHKWGFDFLKIDFLFAAATYEAQYKNPQFSRAQIIRKGVEQIRMGLGKDKTLLGCGAPIGPCIGLVDVMRIGIDTAAVWEPTPEIFKLIAKFEIPSLKPALRATIQRSYMHNTLWINDPDCVVVRENRTKLTMDEVITQLTVFGLSGGQVLVSDDEPIVSEQRIKMLKKILPPYSPLPEECKEKGILPIPAVPLDLFTKKLPTKYAKTIDTPFGKRHLIALINWTNRPETPLVKIEDSLIYRDAEHYATDQSFIIFDFWKEQVVGQYTKQDFVQVPEIPPHACHYWSITPIPKGEFNEPLFLSSTLHIAQGALELSALEKKASNLTIKLLLPGEHEGSLYFLSQQKLKIENSEINFESIMNEKCYLSKISLQLSKEKIIKIQY